MYKQFSKTLKTAALLTTLLTSMTSATSFQVFLGLRATLLGGFKTKNDLKSLMDTVTKIKALDQAKVKTSLGQANTALYALWAGTNAAPVVPITLAIAQGNTHNYTDFDGKQKQNTSILDQMNLIANTLVITSNQGSDTDLSGDYNFGNSLSITLGARFLFSLSGDDFWKAGLQAQGGWAPSGTQTLGKDDKDNASISFTNSLRFSIDAIASFGYGYAGIGFGGQNATIKANDTFNKVINDKKGREELYSALNNTPAAGQQPHGLLLKDTTPAGNNGLLNDTTWAPVANKIKNFFEGDLAKTENFDGTIADGMMFGVNLRLGAMFPVWNSLNLYVEGGNFFSMSKLDSKNASIAASEFYGSLWNPFLELGVALSF